MERVGENDEFCTDTGTNPAEEGGTATWLGAMKASEDQINQQMRG